MKPWRFQTTAMVQAVSGLSDAELARALRLAGVTSREARRARVRLPKAVRKGRAS